jgi:hypothetical protein
MAGFIDPLNRINKTVNGPTSGTPTTNPGTAATTTTTSTSSGPPKPLFANPYGPIVSTGIGSSSTPQVAQGGATQFLIKAAPAQPLLANTAAGAGLANLGGTPGIATAPGKFGGDGTVADGTNGNMAPALPDDKNPKTSVIPDMPDAAGATEAARAQVLNTLGVGQGLANELYAPGSFGRVSMPRQAEMNSLIGSQTAALGGMTAAEQNAARENALLSVNQQANQRLRSISAQAAGNGLRGGVVTGEKAQVAQGAQSAYAQALQELMGKAQKSQVDASTDLGNTLSAARGLEQGAQTTNINAATGELSGRLSTPFNYASALDTAVTNDRLETNAGRIRTEKGTEIQDRLDGLARDAAEAKQLKLEDELMTGSTDLARGYMTQYAAANGVSDFYDLPQDKKQAYFDAIMNATTPAKAKEIVDALVRQSRDKK